MTPIPKILELIDGRRAYLVTVLKGHISCWFESDGEYLHKRRFYAPRVIVRGSEQAPDAIQVTWGSRRPVNNWHGTLRYERGSNRQRLVKVEHKYIAMKKRGEPYPANSFPAADEKELADIMRLEAVLAPIRAELSALGKLRRLAAHCGGKALAATMETSDSLGEVDPIPEIVSISPRMPASW